MSPEIFVYIFPPDPGYPRELRFGEDCLQLITGRMEIPVCMECGLVVAHPMVHKEWHEKVKHG